MRITQYRGRGWGWHNYWNDAERQVQRNRPPVSPNQIVELVDWGRGNDRGLSDQTRTDNKATHYGPNQLAASA